MTGVPLPFISYGGSSMLTNMMIIGLILNVSSQRQTSMFNG
ncbi:MAG: FtsW/RodA/SpoVE family cell cycle protein [Clostridia bacterium]